MLEIREDGAAAPSVGLFRDPVDHLLGVMHRSRGERAANVVDMDLKVLSPLPVYTAPMRALLAQDLVSSAVLTARQYLLFQDESLKGVAELRGNDSEHLAFAGLADDSRDIVDAIGLAEIHPDLVAMTYQLRILRVPELSFQALWLQAPGQDRFMPLKRVPEGLGWGRVYTERALAAALFPLIVSRLKQSSRELA
jgi:hypothetical protein